MEIGMSRLESEFWTGSKGSDGCWGVGIASSKKRSEKLNADFE